MDKKAVAEIRKTMTKNECRIDKITGYFVGEDGEIITPLRETWNAMQEEEVEKYCEIFRKTLTGKLGKNLYNMEFPIAEEQVGGKQAMMYRVLRSDFTDPDILETFCNEIIANVTMQGKYLLLLAHGAYDIPAKATDGSDIDDGSDYVYLFMICAICPVVEVKEGLCYDAETLSFVNKRSDLGVRMPELGFLFPAFNDRAPDIHSLLYFSKKEDDRHPELIDGVIGADMPVTESAQRELFTDLVEKTLGRDCDFENVKAVTEAVNDMLKQEAETSAEPLELGKNEVRRIMNESGVPHDALSELDAAFDEIVGESETFTADSIGGRSTMEIKSPSIKITVKSDMTSMISTKVIDGREYIVIPVQDDIEVNGIRILTTRNDASEN